MTDLEAAQSGCEAYRRAKAREHHAQVEAEGAEQPVQLTLPITGDAETTPESTETADTVRPTTGTPFVAGPVVGAGRRGHRRRSWRRLLAWLRRR